MTCAFGWRIGSAAISWRNFSAPREVLRAAVDGEVHRDDDLRTDLRDDLGRLGRRQGRLAADRHEQHVDGPELADLLVGQQVAEVAEVADVDAVDLDREDHVLAARAAGLAVVVGPDPGDEQVAELVLAGTGERQARR